MEQHKSQNTMQKVKAATDTLLAQIFAGNH